MPSANCRPAWIEVNLAQLRRNFQLINRDKPAGVQFLSVIKDQAYGHGANAVAKIALAEGAFGLGVITLGEAIELRENGITAPILLLGERHESEFPACIDYALTCCVGSQHTLQGLAAAAHARQKQAQIHLKVDTGMSRFGVRWSSALELIHEALSTTGARLEGIMSHFAMSDELDKTFARLQLDRFKQVLDALPALPRRLLRHTCNSGGFLDLPEAHFEMVRIGLLPLGIYPSQVCRQIEGIEPVMTVKARISSIQQLEAGDTVGYGMRYTARSPRRIGVLPIGYGDGFPRTRNEGEVLVHGQRAPLVGGVSMDALTIDITEIPQAKLWDEVIIMGRQGEDEISAHDIAAIGKTVSYDILAGWRARLPRIYLDEGAS